MIAICASVAADEARDDIAKVLAEHDLKSIRPAMPGPGSAWTCRCLQFGVSQNLAGDHQRHVADALLGAAMKPPNNS